MSGTYVLRELSYEHPDAVTLTEVVQAFYVEIYGAPDTTPFTAAEFTPPRGAFLVGYLDEEPVAMGGWRFCDPVVSVPARRPAEIKRMFVQGSVRGRGLAGRLLGALEDGAAAAGADWMVLETGQPQTAAIAFYRSRGYRAIDPFGYYADEPGVVSLGKPLTAPSPDRPSPDSLRPEGLGCGHD